MKERELAEHFYRADKKRYYRLLHLFRRFDKLSREEVCKELRRMLET